MEIKIEDILNEYADVCKQNVFLKAQLKALERKVKELEEDKEKTE